MNRINLLRSALAYLLAAAMLVVSMPIGPAAAGMISTDQLIDEISAESSRETVMKFLGRDDIRRQMEALGVDPDEAAARVDSLSNAEVARIAGQIDQLPAGQDAGATIIGVALAILIVLAITDLLGFTNVYSFITPVQ